MLSTASAFSTSKLASVSFAAASSAALFTLSPSGVSLAASKSFIIFCWSAILASIVIPFLILFCKAFLAASVSAFAFAVAASAATFSLFASSKAFAAIACWAFAVARAAFACVKAAFFSGELGVISNSSCALVWSNCALLATASAYEFFSSGVEVELELIGFNWFIFAVAVLISIANCAFLALLTAVLCTFSAINCLLVCSSYIFCKFASSAILVGLSSAAFATSYSVCFVALSTDNASSTICLSIIDCCRVALLALFSGNAFNFFVASAMTPFCFSISASLAFIAFSFEATSAFSLFIWVSKAICAFAASLALSPAAVAFCNALLLTLPTLPITILFCKPSLKVAVGAPLTAVLITPVWVVAFSDNVAKSIGLCSFPFNLINLFL